MSLALITYPPEVKKGGERVDIVGLLPKPGTAKLPPGAVESFLDGLGTHIRQEVTERGVDIIRTVSVRTLQEARLEAEQFAKRIEDHLGFETAIQPRGK